MVQRATALTLLLCTLLLCSGCESNIYTQWCIAKPFKVSCLRIDRTHDDLYRLLHTLFSDVNISDSCLFTLQGIHYEVNACRNPIANALGSDFDGYVRLEVFRNKRCYYRIQQDFKQASWQQKMHELAERLKTDLQLHTTTY